MASIKHLYWVPIMFLALWIVLNDNGHHLLLLLWLWQEWLNSVHLQSSLNGQVECSHFFSNAIQSYVTDKKKLQLVNARIYFDIVLKIYLVTSHSAGLKKTFILSNLTPELK